MSGNVVPPASRNSPCPCGSGRRYKDCHGSLGGTPGPIAPAAPRRSGYRAPGAEWAHLDEATRDALGERMERALALQVDGHTDAAAREYREVIAAAPATHDALHMLAVVELGRGDLDEAERLIEAALALRPPYQAILHNRQLVADARIAKARAQPEQLAERALPILADLALSPSIAERPRGSGLHRAGPADASLHLIGRFHDDGDDGWMLRRLAELLAGEGLTIWAVDGDGTEAIDGRRVRRLDGATGDVPRSGTHLFVGVELEAAEWIDRADARRAIVLCQSATPTHYLEQLRTLARDGARPLELAFGSRAMAERFGGGHASIVPPVEIPAPGRGVASPPRYDEWLVDERPAWPVGIVGQNGPVPGEPSDVDFVKALAAIAGRLHVYDPGRFRYVMGSNPAVRFVSRSGRGPAPFLSGLACYVHRATDWWNESIGRELLSAMALGIPVLCPRQSIHAEYVRHGIDGFLYETPADAERLLSDLKRAPAMAAAIGDAARESMRELLDSAAHARRWREYAGLERALATADGRHAA